MASLIVYLVLILMFCALGVVLMRGKGAFLIAGYNTASPQEKATYNERALCRAVGTMMFALSGSLVIAGIGTWFKLSALVWTGHGLLLLAVIVGLIYVNTSKRVKRK